MRTVLTVAVLLTTVMLALGQDAKPVVHTANVAKLSADLTDAEQLRIENQGLKIENAAIKKSLADANALLADYALKAAQQDGSQLVFQMASDKKLDMNKYQFVHNDKTGKWEFVEKK